MFGEGDGPAAKSLWIGMSLRTVDTQIEIVEVELYFIRSFLALKSRYEIEPVDEC